MIFKTLEIVSFLSDTSYVMAKIIFAIFSFAICAQTACALNIINKEEWSGATTDKKTHLGNNLTYVIIYHTATPYCSTKPACIGEVKTIQDFHIQTKGWDDIGYNFLIGGDGNAYEGRGWNVVGAHTVKWNAISIGIAFIGDYENYKPTAEQIVALKELLKEAVNRGQIQKDYILYGNRQLINTASPGENLFNEIIKLEHWREKK